MKRISGLFGFGINVYVSCPCDGSGGGKTIHRTYIVIPAKAGIQTHHPLDSVSSTDDKHGKAFIEILH